MNPRRLYLARTVGDTRYGDWCGYDWPDERSLVARRQPTQSTRLKPGLQAGSVTTRSSAMRMMIRQAPFALPGYPRAGVDLTRRLGETSHRSERRWAHVPNGDHALARLYHNRRFTAIGHGMYVQSVTVRHGSLLDVDAVQCAVPQFLPTVSRPGATLGFFGVQKLRKPCQIQQWSDSVLARFSSPIWTTYPA